jgi:hypothetical protein
MKRAALYLRVSTVDQHPETQLLDLRQMAAQRGFEIVHEYTDRISGTKTRRPGLDDLMRDARRGRFDIVLVWASDRIARSVKHFLEVLDELNRLPSAGCLKRARKTPLLNSTESMAGSGRSGRFKTCSLRNTSSQIVKRVAQKSLHFVPRTFAAFQHYKLQRVRDGDGAL